MTSSPATFIFADIAGFTALTEAHGDLEAAELVVDFARAVRAELRSDPGAYVKTIGDAVMLRIASPAEAVRLGLRIIEGFMWDPAPVVRVGLHHGPAVERDGDYIGGTVNVAARVSALAKGGEVLLTGQTAALVPDLDDVFFESRGRQELRNVREPVELFAALPIGQRRGRLVVDPVCKMAVDPDRAVGRLAHEGTAYFFCTLTCAGEFARQPGHFVA